MNDIAIIGNISKDRIIQGGKFVQNVIGGGALNIGIGCKVAGVSPYIIAVVGSDISADYISLFQQNMNISGILSLPGESCTFQLFYENLDQTPQISSEAGVSSELTRHACNSVTATKHLHICCRWPLDSELVISCWGKYGLPDLSVDFIHSSFKYQFEKITPFLEKIKYIFMNKNEFDLLREMINPSIITATLIITAGSSGAMVIREGQMIYSQPASPTDQFIDPSGAGDAFTGAFLGYMLRGLGLHQSMRKASIIATAAIKNFGVLHLLSPNIL